MDEKKYSDSKDNEELMTFDTNNVKSEEEILFIEGGLNFHRRRRQIEVIQIPYDENIRKQELSVSKDGIGLETSKSLEYNYSGPIPVISNPIDWSSSNDQEPMTLSQIPFISYSDEDTKIIKPFTSDDKSVDKLDEKSDSKYELVNDDYKQSKSPDHSKTHHMQLK